METVSIRSLEKMAKIVADAIASGETLESYLARLKEEIASRRFSFRGVRGGRVHEVCRLRTRKDCEDYAEQWEMPTKGEYALFGKELYEMSIVEI